MRWSPCPAYAARTPPDLHRCSSPTWGTGGQRRRGPLVGAHPALEGTPAHLRPLDVGTFCLLVWQKMFSVRAEVREAWVKGRLRPRKNVVRLDLQTGAEGEGRADVSEGAPLLDVVSPKPPELEFHSLCSGDFRGKRPNFESSGEKT